MRYFYLLCLFFCLSCTHRLVPSWYDASKDDLPVTEIVDQDITIRLENLELREKYMIFDLEIVNNSPDDIALDIPSMYCYASSKRFKALELEDSSEDWEQQLPAGMIKSFGMTPDRVDKLYRDKLKAGQNAGLLFGLIAAGLIIYDVAQDVNDASDGHWTERDVRRSRNRDLATATSLIALSAASDINENEQARTAEDLDYLAEELLQVKTVEAGNSVRGKIFIANVFLYKYYRFVLPMEEVSFVFDFRRANSAERQKIALSSY